MYKRAIIPVFLPRAGCPSPPCVFCNQELLTDIDVIRSPDAVFEFVREALQKINRRKFKEVEIGFYGGSFTALPLSQQREYLTAVQPFLANGSVVALRISTRPDHINEEILNQLKAYGVETIELGVQSFDDEVLRLSHRGYDSATIIRSAKLISSANFKLSFHLMVGLPGDTPQKTLHSTQMTIQLKPQFVRIHPILVLKGTELQQMYERGEFIPWSEEIMVATLTEMMRKFAESGIKVIRLGLQPSRRMITEAAVLAGIYYNSLQKLLRRAFD